MQHTRTYEFWLVTGSQHLYGHEPLEQVEKHVRHMVESLNRDPVIPFAIVFKSVLTTPDGIVRMCIEASAENRCAGIIVWMHTFSPAKMWIAGLKALTKPLLHLHTQFNRDIPWDTIDMDFMNLNQSAHGDREFGHVAARLGIARKVVAGHWEDPRLRRRVADWMRVAAGNAESRTLKVARFGDNMREVAVTEGDKVEAQARLGWSVNGYGVGDLAARVREVFDAEVDRLTNEYTELYEIPREVRVERWDSVREQARIELGLRAFLEDGGFHAFTTTFEDLHGLSQLPGLAVQRLMADGYGFGGEGDWKTAALVRVMKMMAGGEATTFMEDYTYHLEPGNEMILGAHMLEVCPSIAVGRPRLEVHPLSIGGKADPARLVFDGRAGEAVCACLVDMGTRFRLIVNDVQTVETPHPLPRLPVARVLWRPKPSLEVSAEAWIVAGGAHHTCLSYRVSAEQLMDWAEMNGVEFVHISDETSMSGIRQQLRWNEASLR